MVFNEHSHLAGKHSVLSPSKYHWMHYDEDKFVAMYARRLAQKRGTELHHFAQQCIKLGQKLQRKRAALNRYVNDAIGFKMTPELILMYSPNAFGSADALSFRNKMLRIHDLKTGITKPSMDQLMVYTALFCLEYDEQPNKIEIELRIYQGEDTIIYIPEPVNIRRLMDKIIFFDKKIEEMQSIFE